MRARVYLLKLTAWAVVLVGCLAIWGLIVSALWALWP